MIALAITGMVLAIAVPAMNTALRASRLDAAADALFHDLREARSKAVMSGWEYQIVGFDNGSGTNPNAYRVFGRRTTGTAWPADDVAPFADATSSASDWTDLGARFPGVTLTAPIPSRFALTFDARGGVAFANFNPVRLDEESGGSRSVTVSVAGSVSVQ